jgi:hypothetical protein
MMACGFTRVTVCAPHYLLHLVCRLRGCQMAAGTLPTTRGSQYPALGVQV